MGFFLDKISFWLGFFGFKMLRKLKKLDHTILSCIGLLAILQVSYSDKEIADNEAYYYDDYDIDYNNSFTHCPDFSSGDVYSRVLILPKYQHLGGTIPRAFFYFFMMLYVFLGISIISNIFMLSIEIICSKTKKVN